MCGLEDYIFQVGGVSFTGKSVIEILTLISISDIDRNYVIIHHKGGLHPDICMAVIHLLGKSLDVL